MLILFARHALISNLVTHVSRRKLRTLIHISLWQLIRMTRRAERRRTLRYDPYSILEIINWPVLFSLRNRVGSLRWKFAAGSNRTECDNSVLLEIVSIQLETFRLKLTIVSCHFYQFTLHLPIQYKLKYKHKLLPCKLFNLCWICQSNINWNININSNKIESCTRYYYKKKTHFFFFYKMKTWKLLHFNITCR